MTNLFKKTLEELRYEMNALWGYLYLTKEVGTYEQFEYNGMDFWDADRYCHKLSQEVMKRSILESI